MDNIEKRLQWIEDRWKINDLLVHYSTTCDDHDIEGLANLYAEDGVFDTINGKQTGRAAIAAHYEKRLADFGVSYHIPYSHAVERISDNEAKGIVLGAVELALNGEAFWAALRYTDQYVKEKNGEWKFFERKVQQLYAMPLADLPSEIAGSLRQRWPGTEPKLADLPESTSSWQEHQNRLKRL
ncbi:MAG: hypothetical protein CL470_05040 [Acidimicrobiaceae bacterium]|nr:hypothetical protein [Acidimicrobiaceae bacterium]|tara:strand:+ start:785 stop:1333 length:549 start_codon:yes stop_codon:yes gene_type:complete